MKIVPVVAFVIVGALGIAQQQPPSVGTPSSATDHTLVSAQMRTIADMLAGTWSISWIDTKGNVIGDGKEVWKFAPGGSAFIEENRSKVNGESAEDYAAMWWGQQSTEGPWNLV